MKKTSSKIILLLWAILLVVWLTCGVLWYFTANYEPTKVVKTYTLQRRPQSELNAIADNLLKKMEAEK